MILFKLLFVVTIFVLYTLFARSVLKMLKMPLTLRSVTTFVVSGGIAGVVALLVQGVLLADQQGHIGDEPQIMNLFVISVIIAVVVSLITTKLFYRSK